MSSQSTGPSPKPPGGVEPTSGLGLILHDTRALLLRPGQAIPKMMVTPGLQHSAVIAGTFVIASVLIFFLAHRLGLGMWPIWKFKTLLQQTCGEILFVGVMLAAVHVSLTAIVKRPDIRIEQSANAVAIALIPMILIRVVFLILSPFPNSMAVIAHLRLLDVIAPAVFLMAALFGGLRLSVRACLYTVLAAVALATVAHSLVAGGGLVDVAAVHQAAEQAAERTRAMYGVDIGPN